MKRHRRVIRRRREVDEDILDNARFIARDSVEVALRFFDAVERTISSLAEMPGKGAACGFEDARLADVRSYAVKGFRNHLVFYRKAADGIDIIAIFHGARDLKAALRSRM